MKVFRKALALGLLLAATAPATAVSSNKDPLPRVEDKLCPGVIGMETESALTLLDRVRYNAVRVGIKLDEPGKCEPNLMISFVPDANASFNQAMDQQPRWFADLNASELRRLRGEMAPARAWNIVRTRTRDGLWVTRREGLRDAPEARMWSAHSKIYSPTREDIVSTMVWFDASQAQQATLKQLADYVSMRAFASDYTSYRAAGNGSILTLFDAGNARPSELTEADLSFLGSLYSGESNIPGTQKEREIEKKSEG